LQTELKEERINLTINGKNYGNALRRRQCYYGNGVRCRRKKYIYIDGRIKNAKFI